MSPSVQVPRSGGWPWFGRFAVLFLVAAQIEGILTSPAERDMGDLEKIFYVHFPAALMMFGAYFVVFLFSFMYLWSRGRHGG